MQAESIRATRIIPRDPASREPGERWDALLCVVIIFGFCILAYASYANSVYQPILEEVESHEWARFVVRPSILWVIMGTILIGFRTILWLRYRPFLSTKTDDAPLLTVVIPAYNEGPMVLKSIESVAMARYPQERLEIFVVDDGSRDDTWDYIQSAAARYPELVTAVRFSENRGKRDALAMAFDKARGEIVVTLDSDSVIEPDALLAIAGPFRDPKVGAVAGKVAVYNRRQGLIPRMLHVRFILAFDFLRAVESSYRTVYCCPGALTAYRASVVRKVLRRWMNQTFLGSRCTFGEDRALTNFILSSGYDTVYQRSAVVHTVAPVTYSKLCKMFIRWDRSYVREEIRFLRIVWKRPLISRLIALCERLITNLRYPVNYASLALLAWLVGRHPHMMVRILIAIGVMSFFSMLYYLRSERSLDFLYGIFYAYFAVFTLFWIFPYAALTVRARSWLTR